MNYIRRFRRPCTAASPSRVPSLCRRAEIAPLTPTLLKSQNRGMIRSQLKSP